ncbi:MAG TPA: hypothetical protein VHH90_09535 [Polyangia bacterium]|nr:hypothetical protein [Polyangia bacterium]HVZ85571.1 hypothetical protein [Polyangia bacterium]
MDANKDKTTDGSENTNTHAEGLPVPPSNQDAGEFKIEIRKLEIPVRPRGVLAE